MLRESNGGWLPCGRTAALVGATLLALAAIAFDWTPLLRGPAPYPPEWRWERRGEATSGRFAPALFAAAGLVGLLAASGSAWARRRPQAAARAILAAGTVLGWGFAVGLVDLEPSGALRALTARAASRTVTSYLRVAASPETRDPLAFVDRHADLLPRLRKEAKHAATHPPGPVLFYRGLIGLCEASPALSRALLRAAGFDPTGGAVSRPPLGPQARAAGLLGALLIPLLGAATVWPLASLARRTGLDHLSAARTGLFWTLVPGAALMTPQFDQALALPVTTATACLAAAMADRTRATRLALLGGVLGGVAVFFSYGAPAFLAIGGMAAWALTMQGPSAWTARLRAVAVALTAAGVTLAAPMAVGHDPWQAARTALAIHREVYTLPRDYALWLVFNPVDLSVFLGIPLALLLAHRVWAATRRRLCGDPSPPATDRLAIVAAAGLFLLLLSGAVRGETGRIWIPLMPLLVVAGVAAAPRTAEAEPPSPTASEATLLGTLLASLCVALRVFWQVH